MKRGNLTIAFYLLLVFGGGAIVGAFGHRAYTVNTVSATTKQPKTPEDYRREYMEEMRSRIKLTDDQAAKVEKIFDQTRDRYKDFRERTKPERDKIMVDQTEAIRALLKPEQSAEYDKMRAERDERRRQSQKPDRGGF